MTRITPRPISRGTSIALPLRPRHRRAGIGHLELTVILVIIALAASVSIPLLLSASARARDASHLARCKENLRALGVALLLYAHDNAGYLPVSPAVTNPHLNLVHALNSAKYLSDPQLFYCPSQPQPALSYSAENFAAGIIGYYYYSAAQVSTDPNLSKFLRTGVSWPHELNTTLNPQSWLMSDIWISGVPTAHAPYHKGVNYLMLDGSVNFITESPRKSFH